MKDCLNCFLKRFITMSLIYLLFDLYCDNNNTYSQHHPLPPAHPSFLSRLKLWFNFILGLNVIFFCPQLIIIHYHTPKLTYLGSMGNCLSRKAEMPTSVVDSGDSLFFSSPSPACQQPHYPHYPSLTPPCPQIDPAA